MIFWKPSGKLDVSTDPTELPESGEGRNTASDALTRFKNLRTDRKGIAITRDGSSKINTTSMAVETELVTNGTFATDISSWTDNSSGGGSISWVSGVMRLAASSGNAIADQTVTISATSSQHILVFDVTVLSASTVDVLVGTSIGDDDLVTTTNITASGTYSYAFTANGVSAYLRFVHRTHNVDVDIDNVSIKNTVDPTNLIVEQAGARFEFSGTRVFRNESSIATGLADAQWSAIKYNAFNDTTQAVFALNGTDRKRIEGSTVYEWGISAPASPTTAVGASTGLTGTYNAKVTYARKVGSTVVYESDPSAAGTARALTNQSLSVTWVASTDTQVTHVRVYRTLANGAIYYHDQDVAVGAVTVDTNTADSSLGAQVETDHARPPLGTAVFGPAYSGTCFIFKDNNLYYCKPKQPEYWPTTNFIEVSQLQFPLKTGVFWNGQFYCLTTEDIYFIQGTGSSSFFPIKMRAMTGSQGLFGAVAVHGYGIYHVGTDGVYLYSGSDRKITEETLDPIFRGETVNGIPGVSSLSNAFLHNKGNRLYFGYTSSGYSYPTNILVMNLESGRVAYHEYNDGSVISIRCVTTDYANDRILVGDTSGFIRVIEDSSQTSDSGTAISWEAQSKDFTLQTRAHFPRYAKYDVDASASTTCTGSILLDGVIHQNHSISGNRNTVRRLVKTGNGQRAAVRIAGSGVVKLYQAEFE